jgi:O-antigen/teichoic acid export membrane protein
VTGILLTVAFSRLATKEVFGNFQFILSILSILTFISIPGINVAVIKYTSHDKDGVYKRGSVLKLLYSLIGIPLLLIIGVYFFYYESRAVGIGLMSVSVFFPFLYGLDLWESFLVGKKRFKHIFIYKSIFSVINLAVVVLVIYLKRDNLTLIILAYVLVHSVFNIIYFLITRKLIKNNRETPGWKKEGYKLTARTIISLLYDNVDKIIIGLLLGPEELAVYSIAVVIYRKLLFFIKEILNVITPKLFEKTKDENYRLDRRIMLFAGLLMTLFVAVIIIIIPKMYILFFSEKYADSIRYAQIYMIIVPISFINNIIQIFLIGKNKINIIIRNQVISICLNLILYFVLIPIWGIYGAIISSFVYFLSLLLLNSVFLRSGLKSQI